VEKYVTCSLCKKRIALRPFICFDDIKKEFWLEKDSKPYWTDKDSGNIYCENCFSLIFWEAEIYNQEA